jgi:hypothetical protein
MKGWLRRLMYGGSARLRGYEAACLGAWSRSLPPEGREVLAGQLARFSMVQRQSGDRLVMFHDLDDRDYAGWPADTLFALRAQEQRAASVWLLSAQGGQRLRCDVVLHRGRLSSLEFARAPAPLFPGAAAESVPLAQAGGAGEVEGVRVDGVEPRLDPLQPQPAPAGRPPAVEALTGWLREWAARWNVEGLKAPLSPAEREAWVKEAGVVLPAGYLDLVAQTDGARVGPVTVYGLGDVRRVLLPDRTVWLLADVPGQGELGVIEEEPGAGLFFFGESDEPEPAGPDFRAALERELGRAP